MLRVQQRPASEESEHNLDAVVREDLLRLQREYRVTEGKRKFTSDQAQNAIRKQSAVIDTLQEENENLKKDLALAGSKQNESKDQHVASTLQELIQKQAAYQERIAQEEKTIEQLEKQINEIRKSVGKQRKEMGGSNMSHHQHVTLQKHLKVMENRLDKATCFEGIQRRHQRELADCKQRMGEIIEMSTLAYEARDEAQSKMLALKEKADKELTQYSTELKELIRVIDHDRKLKEFMRRKDHERTEAHEEMEMTRRKREADKATEREETVMSYEVAFEKIKAATGITDIDQLVHKFIEVEDQNFALFNYVNELNGDIELVQEQIQEIKEEIERFKSQGTEMEEKRKAILRQLEECNMQLIEAAAVGWMDEVVKLLDQGADVNATEGKEKTALMVASYEGHAECVQLLLDRGAQANHQDEDGLTALMVASYGGHVECVNLLLDRGAQVNQQDKTLKYNHSCGCHTYSVHCLETTLQQIHYDRGTLRDHLLPTN
eukprot:Em0008g42a